MHHKAQSAMEYLTTYSWAILIIAVVLAALFGLGVLNPNSSTASHPECIVPSGFSCLNYYMTNNGMLYLKLLQTTGNPITINSASCNSNSSSLQASFQEPFAPPSFSSQSNSIPIKSGSSQSFVIQCYSGSLPFNAPSGSYFSGGIDINYTEENTNFSTQLTGSVRAQVISSAIGTSVSTSSSTTTFTTSTIPPLSTILLSYNAVFVESGLPSGTSWQVTYNGSTETSTTNTIEFTETSSVSNPFSVAVVTPPPSAGCRNIYVPSPSSGTLAAGNTQTVSFSDTQYCYSSLLSDAGGSEVSSLTLDMPSGYSSYISECASGAPYISSTSYSIQVASSGGAASVCDSGSNSCSDIGYQTSPTVSCYTSGDDPWYQSIGSVALNAPESTATVYTAVNSTSGSSLSLNFPITQPGSFVILMGVSGWENSYPPYAYTPGLPSGCTMLGYLNESGQDSAFAAECVIDNPGTYTVSTTPVSTPIQGSLAAYVFPP
jgi:hypothetical protein